MVVFVHSQVTIGSGIPPRDGTLLDLKENGQPHTNPNSNKGLGLPRVKLVDSDKFLESETDPDKIEELEGVMVYNIDKDVLEGAGVYTWNGKKWLKNSGAGASAANIEIKSVTGEYQGNLTQGKTISWNAVRQTLEVDVKSAGAYHIFTNKVAGVQFNASGIFEKTGTYQVDLIASGTPDKGGLVEYSIVQPATTEKLAWIVGTDDVSGNTNKFVYNLEPSAFLLKEGETATVSLKLLYGNTPANKIVKWYVDNQEIKDGAFGTTGVTSKTDTQLKISRSGNSVARIFVMVIDNNSQGIYFITPSIDLQWKSAWLWNITGSLFENKMIYWKIMGKNDFLKNPIPPSSCRCKKQYGANAELSTMRELMATIPSDVTIGKVLSNIYSHKTIDLTKSYDNIYYNIYTKNKQSEEIMLVTTIKGSVIMVDVNTRGTKYAVNASNTKADFWASITSQNAGLDASTSAINLGIGGTGEFRTWIDNMLSTSSRGQIGSIYGNKENAVWKGTYDNRWTAGDLNLESQEITIFGCSVPVSPQ
jgi:hypothetical protein